MTFTLSVIVYLAFVFAVQECHNPKLVPGLIMTGAFLIPMSLLIFFFEMNVIRNVSVYQVVKLGVLGGILSLLLSLFLFQWTDSSTWLGAMSAPGLPKKSARQPRSRVDHDLLQLIRTSAGMGADAAQRAPVDPALIGIWEGQGTKDGVPTSCG